MTKRHQRYPLGGGGGGGGREGGREGGEGEREGEGEGGEGGGLMRPTIHFKITDGASPKGEEAISKP